MDSQDSPSGPVKKGPSFDGMSREELVMKCRGLVGTLIKSKQEREELVKNIGTLQETVAQLKESKSDNQINEEVTANSSDRDLIASLQIENESLKRQFSRSVQENDELVVGLGNLKDKMKAYRSKVIEIAAKFKKLKTSHRETLEVVKEYSTTVPKWQDELKRLVLVLNDTKKAEAIRETTNTMDVVDNSTELDQLRTEKNEWTNLTEKAKSDCKELEHMLKARKQENSDLLLEMKGLNEIIKERGETISRQESELSKLKLMHSRTGVNETVGSPIKYDYTSPDEEAGVTDEKYNKLKVMAVKLKKKVAEETAKVTELEATVVTMKTEHAKEVEEVKKRLEESSKDGEANKGLLKKYNMLALEMESYEKSMDNQTEKLKQKQAIIADLEGTIGDQQQTIDSLKDQLRLSMTHSSAETSNKEELNQRLDHATQEVKGLSAEKQELLGKMKVVQEQADALQSELEEIKRVATEHAADNENHKVALKAEHAKLQQMVTELEAQLSSGAEAIKVREEEIERLSREFSNYKLRAQSILQQNQNQVTSREKELEEKLKNVNLIATNTEQHLKATEGKLNELNQQLINAKEEKQRNEMKMKNISEEMDELRVTNQRLLTESKQEMEEHQNALKAQRMNVEKLTSGYRSQIEDLEGKLRIATDRIAMEDARASVQATSYAMAAMSNNSHPELKRASTDEEKIVEMRLNLERHQGTEAAVKTRNVERTTRKVSSSSNVIPLEDLLNSNWEEESTHDGVTTATVSGMAINMEDEKRLLAKDQQIKHLTMLLAEAEQDVAKFNQQNDLLKEEIRKQQRSEERDAHINNSEYVKNVIFKFITTGEEKVHLIPVLSTILKLSPAEKQKLQEAATGQEQGRRSGWSSYLPFQ